MSERIETWKRSFQKWGDGSISQELKFRIIDSIKPALGMSIAIAVAFVLDFQEPYWAAFAVLMMSFSTTGQAFRRALLGIPGTFLGGAAALTMFALFSQKPIFLIPLLILFCGIFMYFLQAFKVNGYLFFTVPFVCLVVITTTIPAVDHAFFYAKARLEETCLGMTIYGAITLLLWRRSALPVLQEKVTVLLGLHASLLDAQVRQIQTKNREEVFALQRKVLRVLEAVENLVGFAVTDSFEVWQNQRLWHDFVFHSRELLWAQLRWGWLIPEVRKEYVNRCLPDLSQKIRMLEARLHAMKDKPHSGHLKTFSEPVRVERVENEFEKLSHFHRGQVVIVQSGLNKMGNLVHALMQYHCFFHDESLPVPTPFLKRPKWEFPLDIDYAHYALQSVGSFILVAITWFYFFPPGLNNGQFLQLGGAFSLIAIFVTSRNPLQYAMSFVLAASIAVVLYVITIPNLTGYYELGPVIFMVTFCMYFILIKPSQAPLKLGLALAWLAFPKFTNTQVFDFQYVLNSGMNMMLAGLLVGAGNYLITYPLPERRFLRQRKRLFSSAVYLLEMLPKEAAGTVTFLERIHLKACLQTVTQSPQKMLKIAEEMDTKKLGVSRSQLGKFVFSCELLGQALISLHKAHMEGHNMWIVKELSDLFHEWQEKKLKIFNELKDSVDATWFDADDIAERIQKRIDLLEKEIEQALQHAEEKGVVIETAQTEKLYMLLERNRGLSNIQLTYLTLSKDIAWQGWTESRF